MLEGKVRGWPWAQMARPWPRGTSAPPRAVGWCCGTWPRRPRGWSRSPWPCPRVRFGGVAFSPDGKALAAAFEAFLATHGGRPARGGGGVVLWDVAARRLDMEPRP